MPNKLLSVLFILLLMMSSGAAAADAGGEKSVGGISFVAPETWIETPPATTMRAFQYEVPGASPNLKADLAVFYFGRGMGGDVASNIDRWKKQFTELTGEQTEERTVNGVAVTVVTLEGTYQPSGGPMMAAQGEPVSNYAVLGAIAAAPEGAVFFKMTGPGETVETAKAGFSELVNSIR